MPKLGEFLFGKKDKIKKASKISPMQQQILDLIDQGLQTGEGPFGDIFGKFNEEEFNKGVRDPALKNFSENILPQIQEKFIAGNQVLGSGNRRAQNKAGVDLQSKIAELMYGAQNQQKQNRQTGINSLLNTQTFENIYKKGDQGLIPGAVQGFAEGAGKATGAAVAG